MRKFMVWVVGLLTLAGGGLYTQGGAQEKEPDISGIWQGTLQAGNGLRTVLKITNNDGKLTAVMYSIDQGGQPMQVTSITLQGANINFAIKPLELTYTGTLKPGGAAIEGNATQHDQTHALNFDHVTAENAWAIPERPKPMPANADPSFEVATIKPGDPARHGKNIGFNGRHFIAINFDVNDLLALSYGLHAKQIVGAPEWFNTDLYDIDGVPDVEGVPSSKQTNLMMQKLLTDRFQLKFHHEKRELAVYVITVAKGGPKMSKSTAGPDDGTAFFFRGLGDLTVRNLTMADFAVWFQGSVMDKPVVDRTGLTDRYDFTLKWTADDSQFAQFRSAMGALPPAKDDPNAPPSLFTAVGEQLGLKLTPMKTDDDAIVIDHVEKPSAN